MIDPALRRASDLRLDLFVLPQLEVQFPEKGQQRVHGKFVTWRYNDYLYCRKDALERALFDWQNGNERHLVVSDDPGQGKTVLSLKAQSILSSAQALKTIYVDGQFRMVVHWMSRLPQTGKEQPTLIDLLMADLSLEEVYPDTMYRRKVIEYAISKDRLIIILDAFDELPANERDRVFDLFNHCAAGDKARWLITGRDWAINRAIADDQLFDPTSFFRLRIKSFSRDLQNQFFSRALPGVAWREILTGSKRDWDEFLSLPSTLNAILRAYQISSATKKPTRFTSPSDLFCFISQQMLLRELRKETNLKELNGLKPAINQALAADLIERARGAIALEMALHGHWHEVIKDNTTDLNAEINKIWRAAEKRFLRDLNGESERQNQAKWDWTKSFLNRFELNGGSLQADLTAESLVFRNRILQEMNIARYIADFASAKDLKKERSSSKLEHSSENQLPKCIRCTLGLEDWKNSWMCAIRMPIRGVDNSEHGVSLDNFKEALKLLFERPTNPRVRRPTRLMWMAEVKLVNAKQQSAVEDIHAYLALQFSKMKQNGTSEQKESISELLDVNKYVLFCSDDSKLPLDNKLLKRREIRNHLFYKTPSPNDIALSRFVLSKFTLTRKQAQLWDNGFELGNRNTAATRFSWYDCYYFCKFLSKENIQLSDGNYYFFSIPTETQWEYACRAGGTTHFCFGDDISVLDEYAWFYENSGDSVHQVGKKKANAWGLYDMHGNVDEWCWDWAGNYPEGSLVDPVGAATGSDRVLRGGCWRDTAENCASWTRFKAPPWSRSISHGFRLALSPSGIDGLMRAVKSK